MKLIFFDVGSHIGQTLAEVTKPEYPFERIMSFEPMPNEYQRLVETYGNNPKVVLCNFGLDSKSGNRFLYGSNARLEASFFPEKNEVNAAIKTACSFMEASLPLRNLQEDEQAVMNLNCEGAEITILDNLIDTGMIQKCAEILIDFDIRKVPGQEQHEKRILRKLAEIGFKRFSLSDHVMIGRTHQDQIRNWLKAFRREAW